MNDEVKKKKESDENVMNESNERENRKKKGLICDAEDK